MKLAWLASTLALVAGVANAAPPPAVAGPPPRLEVADRRRTVGLLEVRVDGLPDEVKDSFRAQLAEQIDTKRYWLADRTWMNSVMRRSTRWTEGCLVGRCLGELRAQSGAELVLLTALTGSGTSFGYVVTLVRTDTGHVVDQESDRCDVCTVSEVMGRATLAAVEVLNNLPDQLADEAAEQNARVERAVGELHGELAARDRHASRVGAALLAVGLAGAITGSVLYFVNDDRPGYAIATAAGGAALAASGLVVLTF